MNRDQAFKGPVCNKEEPAPSPGLASGIKTLTAVYVLHCKPNDFYCTASSTLL